MNTNVRECFDVFISNDVFITAYSILIDWETFNQFLALEQVREVLMHHQQKSLKVVFSGEIFGSPPSGGKAFTKLPLAICQYGSRSFNTVFLKNDL